MRETARMDDNDIVFDLSEYPVHLGSGAKAVRQEHFDGTPDWYMRYGARHGADGDDGRLVSLFTFTESWGTWEMHPNGEELVACVEGSMVLHQELDGVERTVELQAGQALVNPPGAWHTADVSGRATAFFITSGRGTEIRPR
jgi:mannose-6-phosphate isomerase-like protein (cupin superfamily)